MGVLTSYAIKTDNALDNDEWSKFTSGSGKNRKGLWQSLISECKSFVQACSRMSAKQTSGREVAKTNKKMTQCL